MALPSESWELVLFMAHVHDEANVPQEYNSDQEESTGTITFHEVPCQGNGDVLSFTVDGALGAETNPGYLAAAQASGTFTGGVTEPNPAFAE